jgi:hypothetical protein
MNVPERFRKKPVEVDAFRFDGTNADAILNWIGDHDPQAHAWEAALGIVIQALEGTMIADPGDWIVRGTEGEFYPCKPGMFAATYEPAT